MGSSWAGTGHRQRSWTCSFRLTSRGEVPVGAEGLLHEPSKSMSVSPGSKFRFTKRSSTAVSYQRPQRLTLQVRRESTGREAASALAARPTETAAASPWLSPF